MAKDTICIRCKVEERYTYLKDRELASHFCADCWISFDEDAQMKELVEEYLEDQLYIELEESFKKGES